MSRRLHAMTPATIGIFLGAVGAVCVGTGSTVILLLASAAALFLFVLALVANASRPRRATVIFMSGITATFTWSGVGVGRGLSVAELAPLATVPLVMVVSIFDLDSRTGRDWAALCAPVLMTLGGVIAATAPAANPAPLIKFAVASIALMCALFVLRPDTGEVRLLLTGLISGVVVSTLLGLATLRSPSGRSIGLTSHSNQYAMAAVMVLPLLAYLVREGVVPRVPGVVAACVLVVGVFESGSRSGLLALVVVGLMMAYRFGGSYAAVGFAIVGVAASTAATNVPALASLPVVARLTDSSATARSDEGRIELMNQALGAIYDGNFIIGTGLVQDRLPHNIVLFVWGGFGLLGLVAFLWLVTVLVTPAFDRQASALSAALALGCLGFLTAVALNNLVGASFFWLTAGISMFHITEPRLRPFDDLGHPLDARFSIGQFTRTRGFSR